MKREPAKTPPESQPKVGTQFTGPLAARLQAIKQQTGLPANKLNEILVETYLPKLESGEMVVVSGPNGPTLIDAKTIKPAA